jgi:hypothetical protein
MSTDCTFQSSKFYDRLSMHFGVVLVVDYFCTPARQELEGGWGVIIAVFTLNFLPYKPTGLVSSNINSPTINSTGPNLKSTLMTINSNHQNMMMYQILCGHVNYALGKTRMQVKNTKRHFILDSCLY